MPYKYFFFSKFSLNFLRTFNWQKKVWNYTSTMAYHYKNFIIIYQMLVVYIFRWARVCLCSCPYRPWPWPVATHTSLSHSEMENLLLLVYLVCQILSVRNFQENVWKRKNVWLIFKLNFIERKIKEIFFVFCCSLQTFPLKILVYRKQKQFYKVWQKIHLSSIFPFLVKKDQN